MQDTKEIIKQVRKIDISTKQLVESMIVGNYHSIFKGQGIEFSEIRDYRPGDDIRAIDWKVTARLNHPYVKDFIEERDLSVYFVFDYSASGNFGKMIEKKIRGIEITATLMFSAMRNNDNVGLFLFTDDVEKYIPERKGRKHVFTLLSTLVSYKPKSGKTDIEKSLSMVGNIIKKRSIIFVISDFYDNEYIKALKMLRNRHDVIAIKLSDSCEREIPDIGLIQIEDEETGEQLLVDTSDEEFRKNYTKLIKSYEKRLDDNFTKYKIDSLTISTDEPYEIPLRKFFKIRKRRMM